MFRVCSRLARHLVAVDWVLFLRFYLVLANSFHHVGDILALHLLCEVSPFLTLLDREGEERREGVGGGAGLHEVSEGGGKRASPSSDPTKKKGI